MSNFKPDLRENKGETQGVKHTHIFMVAIEKTDLSSPWTTWPLTFTEGLNDALNREALAKGLPPLYINRAVRLQDPEEDIIVAYCLTKDLQ